MESLQGLTGIVGATRVHERNGGNRGSGDAFRRAMQEQAGEQSAAAGGDGDSAMRTELQRRAAEVRRDAGATFHHVDVIA
ncbi:MAG: hypothetical protein JNM25_10985 [Planctomycetes bacterium]|nr:hypothetical protein [Planctomycetota bacterium]